MSTSDVIAATIHHLSARLAREIDQILQEQLGLTFSQYKILQAIQDNPRVQQRQLALHLGQTEASISRQVKLLVQKQLIAVRLNPKNQREHLSQLTLRGQRLLSAATGAVTRCHKVLFAGLSDKQKTQLQELLKSVSG